MCTGLLAACICNHYQVLRWTTRCAENCLFPSNHLQRVDFQCSGCDALDQEILELEIAAQARVREAARETNRAGAWAQRRSRMRMSEAEMEALRRMLVAEQTGKEKVIKGELERDMQRAVVEWRVRMEGARVRPEDWRDVPVL
jgi:hypothetical protein